MKLVFVIDTVQFFRDVLRSKLLETLFAAPENEAILYTSFDIEKTAGEFQHPRLKLVPLTRQKPHPVAAVVFSLIKDLWTVEHPGSSFTQKRLIEALGNKRKSLALRLGMARLLSKLGLTSQSLIRWSEKFGHDEAFARLLEEEKPDAVVFSNMIPSDLECVKEARRRAVPLILAVASWDNPTSKGPLTVIPDHALVWSNEMLSEMGQCHGFAPDQMSIVGVIYFENYFFPERLVGREEYREKLGLSKETKIIQFATGDSAIIRCNQPFVRLLQGIVAKQPFDVPCHLLVRVSPKDLFSLYEEFEGLPHMTVQYPLGEGSVYGRHSWLPREEEDFERASTLKNADVLLTSGSSIILDACCFDVPVINLAYDCGLDLPPWLSVERFFKYVHAQPVEQEDATWMVRDDEGLLKALHEAIARPETKAAERKRLLVRAVTHTDGRTCERWVEAVTRFVQSGAPLR